jgi:hypothetical protein
VVNDVAADSGVHEINNFIHFHPDALILAEDGAYFMELQGVRVASIAFADNLEIHVEEGWYFPEFGIKHKDTVIRLSCRGKLPLSQYYRIEAV